MKPTKGCLRKIVRVVESGRSGDVDKVLLECGHVVWAAGIYRAYCRECARALAAPAKPPFPCHFRAKNTVPDPHSAP